MVDGGVFFFGFFWYKRRANLPVFHCIHFYMVLISVIDLHFIDSKLGEDRPEKGVKSYCFP